MYLKLDDLEIERKNLKAVVFDIDHRILFAGRALEAEGKRICDRLSKFKEGQIIEVEAESSDYGRYEGICEVVEMKFPPPTLDKAPAIFRFEGILKQVL